MPHVMQSFSGFCIYLKNLCMPPFPLNSRWLKQYAPTFKVSWWMAFQGDSKSDLCLSLNQLSGAWAVVLVIHKQKGCQMSAF